MHAPSPTGILKTLYVEPLDALAPPLIAATPPSEAISVAALLAPDRLQRAVENFGRQYIKQDRRGAASQWSKWYFNTLLVPALLANLLLERELCLIPERLYVTLNAQSRPERLILRNEGAPLTSHEPFERFAHLMNDALTPMIKALASISGASPRVFWSNAGNTFETLTSQLHRHPAAEQDAGAPARQLLERRILPGGRCNPLYRPVRYIEQLDGSRKRVRRLCCIRYLIPELDYCGNCPLLKPSTRNI
ncbi:siderophore-iron reductase FhuF [Pistricoccus aurantiacus]|uniref:Siderophore-iron reductase FhuF n=1 Tax=Pistricoccus aurantiacus TaxID=1883414 RepID=A0A5B8SWH7_9GAMM|nr:siderophore-iron reductase FhuF [Pistricoccus aurantiacus]QEA39138.1 siderophore-iron reductase FhuF [Pistricoccus aurantiacus]